MSTLEKCFPVEAMRRLPAATPPSSTRNSTTVIFKNGDLLTRSSLVRHLRQVLQASGVNPALFSSHSFRIGGATAAATAGLPSWQIQELGRCQTFHRYVWVPNAALHGFAKALVQIDVHKIQFSFLYIHTPAVPITGHHIISDTPIKLSDFEKRWAVDT